MKPTKKITAKRNGTKVVFQCRLSYAHLDEPYGRRDDEAKKYTTGCIIPKDDAETLDALREAIEAATRDGKTKCWKGTVPRKLATPLHDGDEERPEDPAYEGACYITANSRNRVPVLNRLKEPIDPAEAYSGCYALVSVNFFPYDSNGNRGIGAGLNAVLKVAEGERLGGTGDGARDFDEYDLGGDDDLTDL